MSDQTNADKVLLLLVSGLAESVVEKTAVESLGLKPAQAKRLIGRVRRRLAALTTSRDEQLALAVLRLNDLHAKAKATQDVKSAIAAQRELNKLLGLCRPPKAAPSVEKDDASPATAEIAAIRAHLAPLGLADEDAPTVELARLAVAEILKLRGAAPCATAP